MELEVRKNELAAGEATILTMSRLMNSMKGITLKNIGIIAAVAFIAVVLVYAVVHIEGRSLKAEVRYTTSTVIVHNHNDFDWKDVRLEINEMYRKSIHSLESGSSVRIMLRDFAKEDGERFNHQTHRIVKLTIRHGGLRRGMWVGVETTTPNIIQGPDEVIDSMLRTINP